MTEALATKSERTSRRKGAVGRLFVLELSGDRIHSMNPDGSDRKTIVTETGSSWMRTLVTSIGPIWVAEPR